MSTVNHEPKNCCLGKKEFDKQEKIAEEEDEDDNNSSNNKL
jgi:hypothetical protein